MHTNTRTLDHSRPQTYAQTPTQAHTCILEKYTHTKHFISVYFLFAMHKYKQYAVNILFMYEYCRREFFGIMDVYKIHVRDQSHIEIFGSMPDLEASRTDMRLLCLCSYVLLQCAGCAVSKLMFMTANASQYSQLMPVIRHL